MKLGTETGSLVNHLYSQSIKGEPVPEVGMGATLLGWTDRHGATIVGWDGKILKVQRDEAKRIDKNGMSESQDYEYTPNPTAYVHSFKKDKNGKWRECAQGLKTNRWNFVEGGQGLMVGFREEYYDFSF